MFYCTNFSFTTPVDDSYIYFQYAENLSNGYFFHYNLEDGFSSGATSFLYPFLLVPAFWAGISGDAIVVYAFILNSFLLLFAVLSFRKLLESICKNKTAALFGSFWLLVCGPFLWGFFTGMETGLFSLMIILTLVGLTGIIRNADTRAYWKWSFAAAILAICRPEGMAFSIISVLVIVISMAMKKQAIFSKRIFPLFFPVFVSIIFFTVIFTFNGSFSVNTQIAKSYFYLEDLTRPWILMDNLTKGVMSFYEILKGLFLLSFSKWWTVFFPPLTGILFLAGIISGIYSEVKDKQQFFFVTAAMWFFSGMIISTFTATKMLYFNRYQIPLFPIFIASVIFMIVKISRSLEKPDAFIKVAGTVILLLALPSTVFFTVIYGYNCKDIRYLQVEMARYIDKNLPEDARIAINDAGALKYIGNRYTYDIIGLTSNDLALARRNGGTAAIIEYFQSLPKKKRPGYFAIYPEWFNIEKTGIVKKTVKKQYLRTNYSVSSRGKILYEVDWEVIAGSEKPSCSILHLAKEGSGKIETVDRLDVANVFSEKKHSFICRMREMGDYPENVARKLPLGEKNILDCGRSFTGFQQFNLTSPGDCDSWLIARLTGKGRNTIRLFINGNPVGQLKTELHRDRFRDIAIPINKKHLTRGKSRFTVYFSEKEDNLKLISAYHYWLVKSP